MKFGIFDQGDDSGVPAVVHLENRLRIIEAMDRVGFYASYHLAEHLNVLYWTENASITRNLMDYA